MKQVSNARRRILAAVTLATAALAVPARCLAAEQAVLPWDYTLDAIQNFAAGPLAHCAIVVGGIGALLAFAVAGDNELVRRLLKAAIGTAVALAAVHLLNNLAP
jgi:type IV secretory pathway VirB2 component (pilin)